MAEVHLPHANDDKPVTSHEGSDVNLRAILGFLAGLTVACVFINFLVWLLFTYFSVRESRQPAPVFPLAVQKENRLPPEPRLQVHPRDDLRDLRAMEDEILTTYSWVDQGAGIVRIPIDRAMKAIVERGLPVRQDKK